MRFELNKAFFLRNFEQLARKIAWCLFPPESRAEKAVRRIWRKFAAKDKPVEIQILEAEASYSDWFKGKAQFKAAANITNQKTEADYKPLVSFLLWEGTPPDERVEQSINSIKLQTYPNWQLILGGLSLPNQHKLLGQDERWVLLAVESYKDLLLAASGDFVVCVQPGDLFSESFLERCVQKINAFEGTQVVYTDSDWPVASGKPAFPFFKPDAVSPEMLLSVNYLSRGFISRELLLKINAEAFKAFEPEIQEWGWAIQCLTSRPKICHVPEVLVHHAHEVGQYNKGQAAQMLSASLLAAGFERPEVYWTGQGWRVLWQADYPLVSIIIPNKNKCTILKRCLDSIFEKTRGIQYEVVIVDNASDEAELLDYYQVLKNNQNVKIVPYNESFNYSRANNLGAQAANGDLLLFLNNDMEVLTEDWLQELARWALLPQVGVVGTKLLYPNRRIQHAGIIMGMQGFVGHLYLNAPDDYHGLAGSCNWYRNFSAVTGACQMMRRSVFEMMGGYDERYRLIFSDVALCLKAIKNEYRVVYTPFAEMLHYEGQSRGTKDPIEDLELGFSQIGELLAQDDPYFSVNLTYTNIPKCQLTPESSAERTGRMGEKMTAVARWRERSAK
jgi:GT2 family glycosyltransferase